MVLTPPHWLGYSVNLSFRRYSFVAFIAAP